MVNFPLVHQLKIWLHHEGSRERNFREMQFVGAWESSWQLSLGGILHIHVQSNGNEVYQEHLRKMAEGMLSFLPALSWFSTFSPECSSGWYTFSYFVSWGDMARSTRKLPPAVQVGWIVLFCASYVSYMNNFMVYKVGLSRNTLFMHNPTVVQLLNFILSPGRFGPWCTNHASASQYVNAKLKPTCLPPPTYSYTKVV